MEILISITLSNIRLTVFILTEIFTDLKVRKNLSKNEDRFFFFRFFARVSPNLWLTPPLVHLFERGAALRFITIS